MIKVLLAEDHNIVRNGIKMLLEIDHNILVIGEATNGFEVLERVLKDGEVDVVLADINMPEMNGITLIQELNKLNPTIKIIMLSMHNNLKYVSESIREGASGYLMKNVDAHELIFALKHVHYGGKYICAELAIDILHKTGLLNDTIFLQEDCNVEFSMKEIEVIQLIASGYTNQEIGTKLFMDKRMVEGHRQNLIEKTGSRNTAALIRFALINRIIQ